MPLDKEKARINLKEILDQMEKNTDAALLHEYYKLYKKEIPFFKRSFAAAWLFMNYNEKTSINLNKEKPREKQQETQNINKKKQEKQAAADGQQAGESRKQKTAGKTSGKDVKDSVLTEKTVITIPEGEAKNLFISIGKNRRLFPREIIALIINKTSAAREDIGSIRILDNYSFIQVRDSKADEIIEALTGQKFRGRTLTVNYAKPKDNQE